MNGAEPLPMDGCCAMSPPVPNQLSYCCTLDDDGHELHEAWGIDAPFPICTWRGTATVDDNLDRYGEWHDQHGGVL